MHQGEESDLCIRMLAAGYVVRLGSSDPIHHFESPKRSFSRMDHFGSAKRRTVCLAERAVPVSLRALAGYCGQVCIADFRA